MSTCSAEGDRIAFLRQSRGWTQEDLAEVAGCTDRTVRNAESGKAMSSQTLIDIAYALTIELSEIISPHEYQKIVQPIRETAEQVLAWVSEKNVDAILAVMSNDIDLWYSGPESLPYAGSFSGKDQVREFFSESLRDLEWIVQPVIESSIATHDHVVLHGHDTVCNIDIRTPTTSRWCVSFSFRNELITEIRHYQDHTDTMRDLGFNSESA